MTKNLFIAVLVICQSFVSHGQALHYRDYFKNQYSFLRTLNNEVLNEDIHSNLIKSVTERRYKLDGDGAIVDSITLFRYSFDQLGHILEKQYAFKHQDCITEKYTYTADYTEVVDTTISNPTNILLLDGTYIAAVSREEMNYDRNGRIVYTRIEFYDYDLEYTEFEYRYVFGHLPKEITVTSKKWIYLHSFAYEYWPKFKY